VDLTHAPFTLDEARVAGLSRGRLRGASWRRIARGLYVWNGLRPNPMLEIQAALRRLPSGSAFSGLTAAWLHGIDVSPCPVEATVPLQAGVSSRTGMLIHRAALSRADVLYVRGVPATSILRTLADVSSRLSLTEAVVVVDAALHDRRVRLHELRRWIESHSRRPGIRILRRVASLAEPAAESPMESRLRLLLVLAGLPKPVAQVSIHDDAGKFAGRPDLYYEKQRLGMEYDGAIHRTSLAEDNRRQNLLLSAGVRLLRFTAVDVIQRPETVVSQVRAMLATPPIAGKRTTFSAGTSPIAGKRLRSA
jgi:Protein of unknown function (DUF559)